MAGFLYIVDPSSEEDKIEAEKDSSLSALVEDNQHATALNRQEG